MKIKFMLVTIIIVLNTGCTKICDINNISHNMSLKCDIKLDKQIPEININEDDVFIDNEVSFALEVEIDSTIKQTEKLYDIPLDDEIQLFIEDICSEYNIEPELVLAIIEVESNYDVNAISKTGDYGLMQINKCNHKVYNELLGITDFLDAEQNITAGVYMLWDLKNNYGCDTEDKLLMAYNLGINKAMKLWEKGIYSNSYSRKILDIKYNLFNFCI